MVGLWHVLRMRWKWSITWTHIAVRDGIKHEQALTNAEASTKLNTQQLRDMRQFIEMSRVALAETETRDDLAKSVMDAV